MSAAVVPPALDPAQQAELKAAVQTPEAAYEAEVPRQPVQAAPASEPASADQSAELARLSQLHDEGVLTDEEYEAKKQQLSG